MIAEHLQEMSIVRNVVVAQSVHLVLVVDKVDWKAVAAIIVVSYGSAGLSGVATHNPICQVF